MDVGVPVVTVFLQGLLSFFSPCVLPLVPLYLGYLSGGAGQGELYGKRGRLFVNTICFVIGNCIFAPLEAKKPDCLQY